MADTNNNKIGFVYILTNPSFKNDWVKIGKAQSVQARIKQLDTTAVPLPFEIYATLETVQYNEAEQSLHELIDTISEEKRVRKNREYFNIAPDKALNLLKSIAKTINDAVVRKYTDNDHSEIVIDKQHSIKPINEEAKAEIKWKVKSKVVTAVNAEPHKRTRKENFKFSMISVPIGAELVFKPIPSMKVVVVDEERIKYKSEIFKLSPFVKKYIPEEKRTPSDAYQGAKFFTYNGDVLDELRTKIEKNNK